MASFGNQKTTQNREVRATAKAQVPVLLGDASCVTPGTCSTSLKPSSPCHTGNNLPSRMSVFGKPRIRLPGLTLYVVRCTLYVDVQQECTVPGSGARCLRQCSSSTQENPSSPLLHPWRPRSDPWRSRPGSCTAPISACIVPWHSPCVPPSARGVSTPGV